MRMRKKKWADSWLDEHTDYIFQYPSVNKGKWKELLSCDELHVEIGCGKGDYLINMSQMYADEGWIGIEKDRSAAATAARKALELEGYNTNNNRMILADAADILDWLDEKEVDMIHLNFSDPWPKKHYHKRRLSSKDFLDKYRIILQDKGKIRMKTDNAQLFEDSLIYFLQNGFEVVEFSVDYRRNIHDEDAITEYESKFMAEGKPIYLICVEKVDMIQ